jgi:hypothetical protein
MEIDIVDTFIHEHISQSHLALLCFALQLARNVLSLTANPIISVMMFHHDAHV